MVPRGCWKLPGGLSFSLMFGIGKHLLWDTKKFLPPETPSKPLAFLTLVTHLSLSQSLWLEDVMC